MGEDMRRQYEREWFGIEFISFTVMNKKKIAGAEFYDRFH